MYVFTTCLNAGNNYAQIQRPDTVVIFITEMNKTIVILTVGESEGDDFLLKQIRTFL